MTTGLNQLGFSLSYGEVVSSYVNPKPGFHFLSGMWSTPSVLLLLMNRLTNFFQIDDHWFTNMKYQVSNESLTVVLCDHSLKSTHQNLIYILPKYQQFNDFATNRFNSHLIWFRSQKEIIAYRHLRARRAQYSKMFHWEPEGCYRYTMAMGLAPFWFTIEHPWIVIVPFWLSTDNTCMLQIQIHFPQVFSYQFLISYWWHQV